MKFLGDFSYKMIRLHLTFTTLWANSADNKLVLFFLFFQENRI